MRVRMTVTKRASLTRDRHGFPGPIETLEAGEVYAVSAAYGAALVAGGKAVEEETLAPPVEPDATTMDTPPTNTQDAPPTVSEPPAPLVPSAPPVTTTPPRTGRGGRRATR